MWEEQLCCSKNVRLLASLTPRTSCTELIDKVEVPEVLFTQDPCSTELRIDCRFIIGTERAVVVPTYGGRYEDTVLPINDELGFNPNVAPLKELFDAGDMAIIQGVGYENSSRSHFRGMDIWHTCEPNSVATEGWVGKAIRELDPSSENSLTAINFGRGLPRAMVAEGATATSIGELDTYGLMTGVQAEKQRTQALDLFQRIYTPAVGTGPVQEYLRVMGIQPLGRE